MRIADVIINIPIKSISKAYSYNLPEELAFVGAGWRVLVPFGGRKVEGFVAAVREEAAWGFPLKDVLTPVDDEAWFSAKLLTVCQRLADLYLCSLGEIMRLFMPGKSGLKIRVAYEGEGKSRKKIYLTSLKGAPRYANHLCLLREIAAKDWESLRRKPAQLKLLELLKNEGELSPARLKEEKVSQSVVKNLVAAGLAAVRKKRILRNSYRSETAAAPHAEPALTPAQSEAVAKVTSAVLAGHYQGFLLHGVTGSGKTRVYIELTKAVRGLGRQAVILVPEIALTGQTVTVFRRHFAADLAVIHSRLTVAERSDAIFRLRRGEAGVVIGARSAIFTPLADVGLIVLDEEQDMSYKQDESPRYHTRVVAEELAQANNAVLLLGSATPSPESYYRAKRGELTLLKLPERIGGRTLPQVQAVDMREELRRGNRHILSRQLQSLLQNTLAQGGQSIIMLNRRGFSTFVMCRSCGEALKCKLCGLPLVYHRDGSLKCHHCDVQEEVPTACPKCESRYIKYFGSGTEKLEQELKELMPAARIIRLDRDTTAGKFAHEKILDKFRRGEYDILLGTQMVSKGHDLPKVSSAGIVSADSGLNVPDFRGAERTFMLIAQTAGRAGRHEGEGRVIVQSYNPEHYAVQAGVRQDYECFYEAELKIRKPLFYPPFSRLVKIVFQQSDEAKAKAKAANLADKLRQNPPPQTEVIGPSPALIACLRGIYRYVVLIKTGDLAKVREFLYGEGLHLDTEAAIDIDPITMM